MPSSSSTNFRSKSQVHPSFGRGKNVETVASETGGSLLRAEASTGGRCLGVEVDVKDFAKLNQVELVLGNIDGLGSFFTLLPIIPTVLVSYVARVRFFKMIVVSAGELFVLLGDFTTDFEVPVTAGEPSRGTRSESEASMRFFLNLDSESGMGGGGGGHSIDDRGGSLSVDGSTCNARVVFLRVGDGGLGRTLGGG